MVIAFSFLRMGTTVGSILPRRFLAVEIRPGFNLVWGLSTCGRGKEWRLVLGGYVNAIQIDKLKIILAVIIPNHT